MISSHHCVGMTSHGRNKSEGQCGLSANMRVARRRWPRILFSSFEGWTKDYIARDILAGLTLAAITIPEQMATAKLGGFEPQIGFYAFIAATIGFAALGASRVLTAGADSTITPIFAGTLAALATGSSTTIGSAATTLALLVGVMLLAGGILKLGWVANLLLTPVITGFLAGIAVISLFRNCRAFSALLRAPAISLAKSSPLPPIFRDLTPFRLQLASGSLQLCFWESG